MNRDQLIKLLNADCTVKDTENLEYSHAFASDLMSDALAMIRNHPETTVLITGLCNLQTLNTAEMLDVHMIIMVRNKKLPENICDVAIEKGITVLTTEHTMYETCGILYSNGLEGISNDGHIS